MISRRGAMVAMAAATFGRLGALVCMGRQLRPYNAAHGFTSSEAQLGDKRDNSLSAQLNGLQARVYSEEGIPMFLACENLVPNQTSREHSTVPPTRLNTIAASAFHRYADEWQHARPDAPVTDVAKIVELLAYRDFTAGGIEKTL